MKANQVAISIFLLMFLLCISVTAEDITMMNGTTANQTNGTMQTVFQIENKTSTAASGIVKENEACMEQYGCLLTPDGQHYFDCYYDIAEKKCKCFTGHFAQCKVTNNYCSVLYECKEAPQGDYYFDCYLDKEANNCKCFIGAFGRCRMDKSSVRTRPPKAEENVTLNISEENPIITELPLNETKTPPKKLPLKQIMFGGFGIIVIVIILVIVLAIIVVRSRDTPENNLRRARNYHHKAENLHEKGREERAKHYYALAEKYRKRALRKR